MKTRNGKIARLPQSIRQQLNLRLECSEPSPSLLAWLNTLPEVQELVGKEFDGQPVSKQNLAAWRHGGFQEWLIRRDLAEQAQNADELAVEIDGEQETLVDNVAKVMAARYAALLLQWDGNCDAAFEAKARTLNGICRAVVRLQRGVHLARKETAEFERQLQEETERQEEKIRQKKLHAILGIPASRAVSKVFGGGELGEQAADIVYSIMNDISLEKVAAARPAQPTPPAKEPKKPKKQAETRSVKPGQGDFEAPSEPSPLATTVNAP